jgi:hypothetical protein
MEAVLTAVGAVLCEIKNDPEELVNFRRHVSKFETGKGLNVAEKDHVHNGQIIPAIKSVRERLGLSLLEGKRLVDAYRYGPGRV